MALEQEQEQEQEVVVVVVVAMEGDGIDDDDGDDDDDVDSEEQAFTQVRREVRVRELNANMIFCVCRGAKSQAAPIAFMIVVSDSKLWR
ncbi:hypothetical protein E2C01_038770 [Portunus trituberculatus]|uniref:Uncharacterized protein n=1 Tax=Portunus trituberculatus TaxID=210409 RepID=A0A5B7FI12_PORTR|nr:hypothetical protein [Portunus trituberculatus]